MTVLDLIAAHERGEHPLAQALQALSSLGPGETLECITPMEPVPLYQAAERKGFSHQAEPMPDGSWRVTFFRQE